MAQFPISFDTWMKFSIRKALDPHTSIYPVLKSLAIFYAQKNLKPLAIILIHLKNLYF